MVILHGSTPAFSVEFGIQSVLCLTSELLKVNLLPTLVFAETVTPWSPLIAAKLLACQCGVVFGDLSLVGCLQGSLNMNSDMARDWLTKTAVRNWNMLLFYSVPMYDLVPCICLSLLFQYLVFK